MNKIKFTLLAAISVAMVFTVMSCSFFKRLEAGAKNIASSAEESERQMNEAMEKQNQVLAEQLENAKTPVERAYVLSIMVESAKQDAMMAQGTATAKSALAASMPMLKGDADKATAAYDAKLAKFEALSKEYADAAAEVDPAELEALQAKRQAQIQAVIDSVSQASAAK